MRPYAAFAIVGAASFSAFACVAMDTRSTRTGTPLTAGKPFAAGGRIEMHTSQSLVRSQESGVRSRQSDHC